MTETNGPFVDNGVSSIDAENGYDPENGATCPVLYYNCDAKLKPKWFNFIISLLVALVDKSGLEFDCDDPLMVHKAVKNMQPVFLTGQTDTTVITGLADYENLIVHFIGGDVGITSFTTTIINGEIDLSGHGFSASSGTISYKLTIEK